MARMKQIKIDAMKRRAEYLQQLQQFDCTITELSEKYGMTRSRMSQLINKARKEK